MAINDVVIDGLDDIIRDIDKFGEKAMSMIDPIVAEGGNILLQATKDKVHVGNYPGGGALEKSLNVKKQKSKQKRIVYNITWGKDVQAYAAPLELGHGLVFMGHPTNKRVPAYPYLRPAADENKEKIYKMLFAGLNKALETLRK
jgi:hypothetical protein